MATGNSRNSQNVPWTEKYRPVSLDNVLGHTRVRGFLKRMVSRRAVPHLLLYGPPGTGKTSLAFALVHDMHPKLPPQVTTLYLNASDERSLDVVRMRIMSFVQSGGLATFLSDSPDDDTRAGTPRFVVFDEAETMTDAAQLSLRSLLDTHSPHDLVFILICNQISKIHPSLVERMVRFRCDFLPDETVLDKLQAVYSTEMQGATAHQDLLKYVPMSLALFRGDMRFQLQRAQAVVASGTDPLHRLYSVLPNLLTGTRAEIATALEQASKTFPLEHIVRLFALFVHDHFPPEISHVVWAHLCRATAPRWRVLSLSDQCQVHTEAIWQARKQLYASQTQPMSVSEEKRI
jgi:DNA polymerase III delta prime subunit